MANQVAARLRGDDYQHLYAWQFVLELKMPDRNVHRVTIEDALAGSVDDVTVQHEADTDIPDRFYQVKYHVDQRGEYSTEELVSHKPGETSLLEKFWRTWNLLRGQNPERRIELYLVSNWTWDAKDKVKSCIDGRDNGFKTDEFFTASPRSAIGKSRERWRSVLNASEENFRAFISCLHFRLGFDCSDELEQRMAEHMQNLHLKSDKAALLIAVGIVRKWITSGKQEVNFGELETTLETHDLYLPEAKEKSITVYLSTIKEQKFELAPDYIIDWRDYFIGDPHKKLHQLKDPSEWNSKLLPELEALEAQINRETDCRLVRARGLARLSAWFAFGFLFSEVARYNIEVDQNSRLWRTDANASSDFHLIATSAVGSLDGEILDGEGSTVAVGISVTGSLDGDVRAYLAQADSAALFSTEFSAIADARYLAPVCRARMV